ncbi:transcriptional regulator, ArsR family [Marvinbryantia formatexigens DSM 14469]|uniref:Transcriptional regulator, ArsR family n=1 Tax=Marvinbryantia formatexigens DSM 14469 TaxID=478749 RepID=C6LIY3_9FIRM|nr:transcriptional regulator [Marvinbryantia formatexigens]EET59522.1 transcriptional regulator, ArsR family [Marvinbryantia formatexigens DSM 14469]UWO24004.1 transcriptional regulator [Marvinbryantia formatexigens DSM 14469]SDG66929.1 Winged helix DNA-binding domain-containing protein [Marvinbryantia formatexigens]
MQISNIPEAFSLSIRIKLISCLLDGEKSFKDIKQITKATDGNISVQLSKLEEWGYVRSEKTICGKRPKTSYKITDFGIRQFEEYVSLLESMLKTVSISESEREKKCI